MSSVRFLSSSGVAKGRAFEQVVLLYLLQNGFFLRSTGKAGDGGVDFRGTWNPNNSLNPIPVVGQCKALSEKVGVQVIRELEGTLCREEPGCLGVLVSEKGFSLVSRRSCYSSKFPIILVGFHPLLKGKISEFWYNDLVRSVVPNLRIGFSFIKKDSNVIRIVHLIDSELRTSSHN
ncbi:hypothetical protein GpartN1_g5537.t1 [Galdieria partita]|uniref:Restriction endonuclease type IV Mrr domain-containing protein n=1 Tax=Galdieria partita TaxID=83374 RepID=A0A9C7Q038_9RHOD|nr:hypothetical protein GpartN1_g5537.t1 [Galdieria partita]